MKKKTTDEWIEIFDQASLPYSPINTIDKVVNDPVINYRGMIAEIEQPRVGKMKIVGTPFRLSATPAAVRTGAPLIGQHTDEVLSGLLGYSKEEIISLRENNVVK